MANVTYTVKRGDTLSAIASKYNTTVSAIMKLNPSIKDANKIYQGQVIVISGTAKTPAKNTSNKAIVTDFGILADSDRSIFACWSWDKSDTDHYQMKWEEDTGDGHWFYKYEDIDAKYKYYVYTPQYEAKRVRFSVKPIAKKKTVNNKETTPWTAEWSTSKIMTFKAEAPDTPSAPSLTIFGTEAKIEIDNLPDDVAEVKFELYRNNTILSNSLVVEVKKLYATVTFQIPTGYTYKARCRLKNKSGIWSEWSNYSNSEGTVPFDPGGISVIRALSPTSVYLKWNVVKNAESYDVQYTTNPDYFDSSSDVSTTSVNKIVTHAEITGLESGQTYYFRVRAVNEKGESGWTDNRSIVLGKKPAAPTTWSSTTTCIVGEPLILYWNHNSEDGSAWVNSQLKLIIGVDINDEVIQNTASEEDKYKTYSYKVDTSTMTEGTRILWMVRTSGITGEYGDWSILRTIDVYARPTLYLDVTDQNGNYSYVDTLPLSISATAYPTTQRPTGYTISISANESHMATDNFGNEVSIGVGEVVFSKYYNTYYSDMYLELSAKDLRLENNVEYKITCTVSMNSGLTAEASQIFRVGWEDYTYIPNAEITINKEDYSVVICPYCDDGSGVLIEDTLVSVYRREFDGTFTPIVEDVENMYNSYYIDPHPSLDYARYRIVAKTKQTGKLTYYDMPGIPVGGNSIIIQWNSKWVPFNVTEEDNELEGEMSESPMISSMLLLPYNIDVSESTKLDVELVEYIGRSHPVSYYGTQVGSTQTWNTEIPKDDKETLHALRRLQIWMGDVYVREPSGNGYWANVEVSFNQKHLGVTIPVSLNITRVEGGM